MPLTATLVIGIGGNGYEKQVGILSVTDMYRMFNGANAFNQPIGNWDVSSVQRMESVFRWAFAFNKSITDWNVSSVTNMSNMFWEAFNQDIWGCFISQ